MHRTGRYIEITAALLSVVAAMISFKLLTKHVTGASGSAWFDIMCDPTGAGGVFDCDKVLASPFSYFPPKRPTDPPDQPRIPVAFFGMLYYSALAVWFVGVGRPSRQRRWIHLLPGLLILSGLAASGFFTYLMFAQLEQWCPWCAITHALNLVIAICFVRLWPRRPVGAGTQQQSRGQKDAHARKQGTHQEPRRPHPYPSGTRVWGTIGVILIVIYGNYGQYAALAARNMKARLNQCVSMVQQLQGDAPHLLRQWQQAEARPITIRPDDPIHRPPQEGVQTLEVVVFSDFECPACARFAAFFDDEVQPLFDHRLALVFKHYPLDQECNPETTTRMHPHACELARMAEAARIVGGNDAFWKAHDLLFARRSRPGAFEPYSINELAAALGLDGQRLYQAVRSPHIDERIAADAQLARRCGVRGTPTAFVNRKLVPSAARGRIEFWDALAQLYWKQINTPRPEETRIKPETVKTRTPPPIPDNQGPKDGP